MTKSASVLNSGAHSFGFLGSQKLPCFFKLSRIPSPSRKNGVILLAAISNDVKSGHAWNHAELFHSWRSRTLSKNSCKNSQFENLNDALNIDAYICRLLVKTERIILFMRNRESAFVFRRRVHSENFTRKRKLWFSLLSDAYNYKAQPNDRNIVGCNMLCAIGHPVATFWGLLAQSRQFTTSITMHSTYVAIYWVDMLRSFGRGLPSMPKCLFATYWAEMERSILFMKIVNRYLERQQFFLARKRFSLK